MAARIGYGKTKLAVVSQLHGLEAASTEAVLAMIEYLAEGKRGAKKILKELDILFVVRANVDAGDPVGQNFEDPGACVQVSQSDDYGS